MSIVREFERAFNRQDVAALVASIAVGWVEGWFFKDKKLRNYKPGLTTYDNNTFMKVWIAQ